MYQFWKKANFTVEVVKLKSKQINFLDLKKLGLKIQKPMKVMINSKKSLKSTLNFKFNFENPLNRNKR